MLPVRDTGMVTNPSRRTWWWHCPCKHLIERMRWPSLARMSGTRGRICRRHSSTLVSTNRPVRPVRPVQTRPYSLATDTALTHARLQSCIILDQPKWDGKSSRREANTLVPRQHCVLLMRFEILQTKFARSLNRTIVLCTRIQLRLTLSSNLDRNIDFSHLILCDFPQIFKANARKVPQLSQTSLDILSDIQYQSLTCVILDPKHTCPKSGLSLDLQGKCKESASVITDLPWYPFWYTSTISITDLCHPWPKVCPKFGLGWALLMQFKILKSKAARSSNPKTLLYTRILQPEKSNLDKNIDFSHLIFCDFPQIFKANARKVSQLS
jgi:hypothetical protein